MSEGIMLSQKHGAYEFRLIRSSRKTCAIEIKLNGDIIVRAPMRMPQKAIIEFVNSKHDWIDSARKRIEQSREENLKLSPLSSQDIKILSDKAKLVIPPKVAHYAELIGVTYNKITVRKQKTRWGSCSSIGNLNFNCLLMLTPNEVLDYVIVHELCHRKHMNHSKEFWREVERIIPDYKVSYKWLKNNGSHIIKRINE
jgi:predicted metal-dependent hydrolase